MVSFSISKNTLLTTDLVVNIVFFETLATEKSATGDSLKHGHGEHSRKTRKVGCMKR